jgi:hypothetical protein
VILHIKQTDRGHKNDINHPWHLQAVREDRAPSIASERASQPPPLERRRSNASSVASSRAEKRLSALGQSSSGLQPLTLKKPENVPSLPIGPLGVTGARGP